MALLDSIRKEHKLLTKYHEYHREWFSVIQGYLEVIRSQGEKPTIEEETVMDVRQRLQTKLAELEKEN